MKKDFKDIVIGDDLAILDTIIIIKNNKKKTVLIQKKKTIIGLIDIEDIINFIINKKDLKSNVKEIMNTSFKYLQSRDITKAKILFKKFNLHLIPVLNKKRHLTDIIYLKDLIK